MAKLTGAVNFAVFAAFWPRVGSALLSNSGFKPVCGGWQLDVLGYGRQKRQDRGKKRQRCGNGWQGGRQTRQGWGTGGTIWSCQGAGGAGWHHVYRTKLS